MPTRRAPPAPAPAGTARPRAARPDAGQPESLDACRRCDLWRHATQAVPGSGRARAPLMLVGEQPGNQEDLDGRPFVGQAGRLLDEAFGQAGVARDSVYLTNAVKHFKFELRGKRRLHKTPGQLEIEACGYWLDKELARVKPRVVLALGATALKAVLHRKSAGLAKVLGQPVEHEGRIVIATWHPSYVLRMPDEAGRRKAFGQIVEALRLAARIARDGRA
ncbi:UdgX family uracil-DNA binding protein [Cupriavidus sp. 30B13]|uniref:UdgX family uracil-DNA binding protein n=1 Tax=Cupriavidus sp. 30B13 TaxID=3384241 RepID=UPI003B919CBA